MKSLREKTEGHLSWKQPKATHQIFELKNNGDLLGKVVFPKSVGSLAEAETSDGKWTFKRVGFFTTRITIRKSGEEEDIAVFRPNLIARSGSLEFSAVGYRQGLKVVRSSGRSGRCCSGKSPVGQRDRRY